MDLRLGRRDLFRAAAVVGVAAAAASVRTSGGAAVGAAAAGAITPSGAGIRAFKLYTGRDNASHVLEGTVDEKARTDVIAIHFKETPAHSSYDWHPDPEPQYVITLSGTLSFRRGALNRAPNRGVTPHECFGPGRFAAGIQPLSPEDDYRRRPPAGRHRRGHENSGRSRGFGGR
jgi:hypothetical protein